MQLKDAVQNRRSIRAFRPDPVPPAVLREILDIARWTSSAANTQPWEFTIVGGEPLRELRSRLRAEAIADPIGKPEMRWPPNLPERFKERRQQLVKDLAGALGTAADDEARKKEWHLAGIVAFDAPQVIVLTMERCFSELAVLDLGAVAFAIELLAHGEGLGTCPEAASLRYPWIFQEILGIPESKRVMLVVPIGYPVQDAPVNHWQRTRISTDEVLKWVGIAP